MRHRAKRNRLGKASAERKALLASLATELIRHDEITTTLARAKAVRAEAERMITLAKRGYIDDIASVRARARQGDEQATGAIAVSLACRRQVAAYLKDHHNGKTITSHRKALAAALGSKLKAKAKSAADRKAALKNLAADRNEILKLLPDSDAAATLVLENRDAVKRLFKVIAPRYKDRHGGYTRIIRAGFRRGDATPMAIIQLV